MIEYLTRRSDYGHTWYNLCDTIIYVFLFLVLEAVLHFKEFMMKLELRNKYVNAYFIHHLCNDCMDYYNCKVLYDRLHTYQIGKGIDFHGIALFSFVIKCIMFRNLGLVFHKDLKAEFILNRTAIIFSME